MISAICSSPLPSFFFGLYEPKLKIKHEEVLIWISNWLVSHSWFTYKFSIIHKEAECKTVPERFFLEFLRCCYEQHKIKKSKTKRARQCNLSLLGPCTYTVICCYHSLSTSGTGETASFPTGDGRYLRVNEESCYSFPAWAREVQEFIISA